MQAYTTFALEKAHTFLTTPSQIDARLRRMNISGCDSLVEEEHTDLERPYTHPYKIFAFKKKNNRTACRCITHVFSLQFLVSQVFQMM